MHRRKSVKAALKVIGFLGLAAAVVWLSIDTFRSHSFSSASEGSKNSNLSSAENSKTQKSTSLQSTSLQSTTLQNNEPQAQDESMITDFSSSVEAERWRTVNDTVMGGVSQSQFSITPEETGRFTGTLSLENNGGFSSVRRDVSDIDLSGVTEVSLRVKGDGRSYQLRLKMSISDRAPSYRAEFETRSEDWITITLPISDFEPVFRGRIVEDAPRLIPNEVVEIGLLLADEQSGEFALELDWIRVR